MTADGKCHIYVTVVCVLSAAGWRYRWYATLRAISISKNYLLVYPDGSRKNIGRAKRDQLLLSGLAKQTAPQRYLFIGEKLTMHSMPELGKLKTWFEEKNLRHFYPGSFIFEHEGKRYTEMLETPEAMAMRMSQKGDKTCQDQQLE